MTLSHISTPSSSSLSLAGKSDRDITDFVKYLLDGSGAEDNVDFAALRRDFENDNTILHEGSIITDNYLDNATSIIGKKYKSFNAAELEKTDTGFKTYSLFNKKIESQNIIPDVMPSSLKSRLSNVGNISPIRGNFHVLDQTTTQRSTIVDDNHRKSQAATEHNTAPSAAHIDRVKLLSDLSSQLMSLGFPSLHPSLLYAPTTTYSSPGSLSDRQIEALHSSLSALLTSLKSQTHILSVQDEKITELTRSNNKLKTQFDQNSRIMSGIGNENSGYAGQVLDLEIERDELKGKVDTLKKRCERVEDEYNEKEHELQAVKQDMHRLLEKYEKEKERNEHKFKEITSKYHRDPNKSGIDRLTLQIIQSYEEKLENLRKGKSFGIPDVVIDEEEEKKNIQLKKQLREREDEVELLKIQLESSKRNEYVTNQRRSKSKDGSILSTRELINRDKKSYKMKLFSIDELELDVCQDYLKHVCAKLDVDNVEKLINTLDDIEKVLRLIPQMQKFISQIDAKIWSSSSIPTSPRKNVFDFKPSHKLTETLDKFDKMFDADKNFLAQISSLLFDGVEDMGIDEILGRIEELKKDGIVGMIKNEDSHSFQAHFSQLFNCPPHAARSTLKTLYVFKLQIDTCLGKLKGALGVDGDELSASQVLLKAVEVIEGGKEKKFSLKDSFVE